MDAVIEGDLQIDGPATFISQKFDGRAHGLSHCMKAVDFVLEGPEIVYLLEIKDPDNPKAGQYKTPQQILDEVKTTDLVTKCRDTFLYLHLLGRIDKKVIYLVLIAASSLDAAQLLARTEELKRQLPLIGPERKAWQKPFIENCAVLNLEAWNRNLKQFQLQRRSAT